MIKSALDKTLIEIVGTRELFTVPYFQRRYVWGKENWEEMINNIKDELNSKNSIYWGNIIWKEVDTDQGKPKKYKIIDGQQRITTISLLLLALYNAIENKEEIDKDIIKNILLVKNDSISNKYDNSDVKLELSIVDRHDYNTLVEPLKNDDIVSENELEAPAKYNSKIKECYRFFKNEFENKEDSYLCELFKLCLNDEKRFVLITLDKDVESEQSIFDTINRAGQRLTNAEIIKNKLYEKYKEEAECSDDEIVQLYKSNWESIFETSEDNSKWYETEKIGNNIWSRVEHLMFFVCMIEWGISKSDKIVNYFTEKVNQLKLEEIKELVNKIRVYGIIYKKYIIDFDPKNKEFTEKSIGSELPFYKALLIITKCDLKMMYPYLIALLYKVYDDESETCNLSDKDFVHELNYISRFVLRNNICDMKYSNGITELVAQLIVNQKSIKNEMEIAKKNEQKYKESELALEDSVFDLGVQKATLILFLIEMDKYESASDTKLTYNYELEHIMPKEWKEYWGDEYNDIDEKTESGHLKKEEFERQRNKHIKYLGNMLLITKSLNSSIKHKSINTKVKGEKNKNKFKGYETCCSMKLVKDFLDDYKKEKSWNEENIDKRTKKLLIEVKRLCEW